MAEVFDPTQRLLTPMRMVEPGSTHTIVIVGCGGIGARLFPTLVKLLGQNAKVNSGVTWNIHAIDHDTVEERNLLRQPFILDDIGRPKAEAMAERYSTEDVIIHPHVLRVGEPAGDAVVSEALRSGGIPTIIGALDSAAVRGRLLETSLRSGMYHTYIDAGNDGNRGQVLLASGMWYDARTGMETTLHGHLAFPEVFVAQPPAEPTPNANSCSLAIDTQTPLANNMAATLTLNYFGMLLHQQPIGSLGVTFSTMGAVEYLPATKDTKKLIAVGSYYRDKFVPLSVYENAVKEYEAEQQKAARTLAKKLTTEVA